MSMNPAMQACDNLSTRYWWSGWLVGVLSGIIATLAVAGVSWWLGGRL